MAMQDVLQLLREGRTGLEAGAGQQNLLAPYLLQQAGLEPEYEDLSPQLAEKRQRLEELQGMIDTLRAGPGKAQKAARKALVGGLTGEFAGLSGKKLKMYLKKQKGIAEREVGELSAAPLRITGYKEGEAARGEREREADILRQEQELLQKSLGMTPEEVLAADPALKRQLEEEQAQLEQAQVNQFGSLAGAQGGTRGAVQNAAMAQRRAEAIAAGRRENIGLYAGLQTAQAANKATRAAQLQQMSAYPSQLQQQSAMNFGQLASGFNTLFNRNAQQRQLQYQANAFNQTQPSLGEKIMSGIGSMFQPFKGLGGGSKE